MEDKDIIFGSVEWQKRFNKGKWNAFCNRQLAITLKKAKPFDHQAAFRKFCKRQGMATALSYYFIGDETGQKQGRVEHHYIESNEPEVDNKTFKLKPLTQPESEILAA